MNKRAQTEVSLGTILLLILGVVALIIIVVGFSAGWGYIFSSIGLLPDDLTKMAMACKISYESNLINIDSCVPKEGRILGKKGWYNCEYVYDNLKKVSREDKIEFEKPECGEDVEKEMCNNLKFTMGNSYKDSIIVNGQSCGVWLRD